MATVAVPRLWQAPCHEPSPTTGSTRTLAAAAPQRMVSAPLEGVAASSYIEAMKILVHFFNQPVWMNKSKKLEWLNLRSSVLTSKTCRPANKRPRDAEASVRKAAKASTAPEAELSEVWLQKYRPTSVDQLAVHVKKVSFSFHKELCRRKLKSFYFNHHRLLRVVRSSHWLGFIHVFILCRSISLAAKSLQCSVATLLNFSNVLVSTHIWSLGGGGEISSWPSLCRRGPPDRGQHPFAPRPSRVWQARHAEDARSSNECSR